MMRVGIAADHGGFALKREVVESLRGSGYEVVDFGAHQLTPADDYPDFIIPLARAVAAGEVERGVALCGSGVGASIAANKIPGVRAGLIHDVFSAHQGVEDDDMNVFCLGGKVIGSALAWELIETFLAARSAAPIATSAAWQSTGARPPESRAMSVHSRRVIELRTGDRMSQEDIHEDRDPGHRLFPGSLDVIERLRTWGPTVILSDGDVILQPHKIERFGLFEAVGGHVLIYIHKERQLDDVEKHYPAHHYVLVDDKLRILSVVKKVWGSRVTAVSRAPGPLRCRPHGPGHIPACGHHDRPHW